MLAIYTIVSGLGTNSLAISILFLTQAMAGPAIGVPPTVAPAMSSLQDTASSNQRDGEEFSNNLVSDLAPYVMKARKLITWLLMGIFTVYFSLLALFGERFAQQYMSVSTSWVDSLIFAMAPLGMITAIVGAVRVGGSSWLKSLVGRARETRAAAEVELMSSTSHEGTEHYEFHCATAQTITIFSM